MKKRIFTIAFSLFVLFSNLIFIPSAPASDDKYGIQDPDCDSAAKALTGLMDEIKHGKLSGKETTYIEGKLSENISKYNGDPEKCIMVSPDFVKILSIDALAELRNPRFRGTFERLLSYLSEFQPGDIRQHAAAALAKIKSKSSVPLLLSAIRDKNSFMIGYREDLNLHPRLTIGQQIQSEKRDLRLDPYSYPMIEALKTLASPGDYASIRGAIESEYEEYLKGKSVWNDPIRADMLRIAASLDGNASIALIDKHKNLSPLQRLRGYAFINSPKIVPALKEIIVSTLKMQYPDVPEETKLAFNLLKSIKAKEARLTLRELASSPDASVSFMAAIYLARNPGDSNAKSIKAKIVTAQDRLRQEGMKILAELKDRNSIPIIKGFYTAGSLKLKVYAIWSLANLKVKDPLEDAIKLKDSINTKQEEEAGMNLSGSLDEAINMMENAKSAYPSYKKGKN